MMRSAFVVAALAATAASAEVIPPPIQPGGDGGFVFAAWDDTKSYTYYLGFDFFDIDTDSTQTLELPDFVGYFDDLSAVTFNITAADGDGDGFFEGGLGFYSTGSVSNLTNDAGIRTVIAAIDDFVRDVNQACPDTAVCFATSEQTHYAGRDSFGVDFGLAGGVNSGGSIGELVTFILTENEAFNPDGQVEVMTQPFSWLVTADGTLSYVPVPAAFWFLLSGVLGLAGIRRR